MKKNLLLVLVLATLAFCVWLVLRQPKTLPNPVVSTPTPILATNIQTPAQVFAPVAKTNIFVRPDSINEETWNKWMAYRQLILEANQPVEFYARVLDQSGQPVEGAKLKLKLSRMDETMFATTNFSEWDPAKAVQEKRFDLYSDANGWFQVTGTNGSFLDMAGLTKEGYSSSYPDGNFGGVHYEPGGVRTTYGGDIQTTNALNPQKGYILHLQKIEAK